MNIQRLILVSISPSLLTACPSTWGCNPDSETFDLSEDILAEDVQTALDKYIGNTVDSLSCEDICEGIALKGTDWEYSNIDNCEMELDTTYFASEDSGTVDASGDTTIVGNIQCDGQITEYMCKGRRPMGYQEVSGGYFARAANLEAASVIAFIELAAQLQKWKAPHAFIVRCLQAAEDERRHTKIMMTIAQQYTQSIPALQIERQPSDLFSMALHNATEGCIHETWSALEAHLISHSAKTPELRSAFAVISREESAHAQLSWDLHHWFCEQLTEEQVKQLQRAQRLALQQLPNQIASGVIDSPVVLGLHSRTDLNAIAARFITNLSA